LTPKDILIGDWFNIGDLYDNENWMRLDPVEPIYFVSITSDKKMEKFHIEISYHPSDDPNTYYSCYSASDVKTIVGLLKAKHGNYEV